MSYVEKLRTLPHRIIQILRKMENIQRKMIKCKWSLVFNNTCIKENLLPTYTNLIQINDELIYQNRQTLCCF